MRIKETLNQALSKAFHQKSDPVKKIFDNEFNYLVKTSLNNNPFAGNVWKEEIRAQFISILETDDKDLPGKLHELALKLDQEMKRT
ncbi:hypothetical protein EHS13_33605 [Paenibacillus psychroresistens]|uniref:Uncharacterized protein n=1 Tax=Paenibacillus psychroresistens TaxID=1778678 RepID=A0A6B8RWH4_9BACL|nr:hypothetical protein [Paenibacillus psychroresistens]QGQ99448.1 hypothetical protein EHS13_33605 [Paenibacillus psychroresistens]